MRLPGMQKNIVVLSMVTVLFSGWAMNPMTSIYNDDCKITGEPNAYNLDAVEQEMQISTAVE